MCLKLTPDMYRAVSFQFRKVAFLMSFTLAMDHISLSQV